MKSNHTKGNWEVSKSIKGETLIVAVNGTVRTPVALVFDDNDTNLLVSAPDLLKALDSLSASVYMHPDCEENSEFGDFNSEAVKAINKATKQ